MGDPQQAEPPVRILGVRGGAHYSWGAGIWVQANGRVNNIICAFFSSCMPVFVTEGSGSCGAHPALRWGLPFSVLHFPHQPFRPHHQQGAA